LKKTQKQKKNPTNTKNQKNNPKKPKTQQQPTTPEIFLIYTYVDLTKKTLLVSTHLEIETHNV